MSPLGNVEFQSGASRSTSENHTYSKSRQYHFHSSSWWVWTFDMSSRNSLASFPISLILWQCGQSWTRIQIALMRLSGKYGSKHVYCEDVAAPGQGLRSHGKMFASVVSLAETCPSKDRRKKGQRSLARENQKRQLTWSNQRIQRCGAKLNQCELELKEERWGSIHSFIVVGIQKGIVAARQRNKGPWASVPSSCFPCSEGLFVLVRTSVCPPKGLVRLTELQKCCTLYILAVLCVCVVLCSRASVCACVLQLWA